VSDRIIPVHRDTSGSGATTPYGGKLSPVPSRPTAHRIERIVPWLLRGAWIAVVLFAIPAVDAAFDDQPDTVHTVARVAGGALWLIGVAAMAVPAVVSLTATRIVVPLSVPVSLATTLLGADAAIAAGFVGTSLAAAFLAASAPLGRAFVQASAYGDEDRHLLRPPLAYLVAVVITWVTWAAALLVGPVLLADRRWLPGTILCAVAVAGVMWAWRRWHRLARRWFVLVPTGVVVHDQLVLGETLMVRRNELAALRLAPAGTEALDLTGPAAGHAVELVTRAPTTAILAGSPKQPRGRALHFTACLVSPTRPGRFLAAAGARRFPVG
jgi:hypothetical protein